MKMRQRRRLLARCPHRHWWAKDMTWFTDARARARAGRRLLVIRGSE